MKKVSQEPVENQEEVIIKEKKKTKVQATEKKEKATKATTPKTKTTKKTAAVKIDAENPKESVEKIKKVAAPKKPKTKASEKKADTEIILPPVIEEVKEEIAVYEKASLTPLLEEVQTKLAEPIIPTISSVETEEVDEHDELAHDLNETELVDKYAHLTKEELIETLTELLQEDSINSIKNNVSLIKVAFHKIIKEEKHQIYEKFLSEGGVKEEFIPVEDEAEINFKAAFEIYKERKNKYNEEQEKIKLENLALKLQIIEDLKVLINSEETLKRTYDDFKVLQEKWKEIGQVPHTENNTLWQNYHFLIEKFFDKVKINKELKDLDLRKNMEAKIQICEKTEELLLESSIIVSFKKLQEYHEEWKEIGPVPMDKKDEIWERFKTASDQINQRRHEFYETQHKQEENNLLAKTALCEKAEQILSLECVALKEWQDATNELNDLLKIWKTVGPAPKKQNNEIWARFKTYLDSFFANRNEFFGKVKDDQQNNYNLKVDLCLQAEAIKDRNDWKFATNELLELQKQWKTIGAAPRKQQDKVWLRFRAACDEFFKKKADYFSHINEHEAENLKLKEALIEKVKSFTFGDNRNDNLTSLKEFQREWSEIGHIPIKEKERIQAEFRKVINTCFEQLKISNVEASAINYKQKVDSMKDSGGGRQFIGKEKMFISGKIAKLREDINLWENNIGFLANSKQADILKDEFAKKIESAKQEVILLEAKFKMLMNS
ncbi:MAG: DUF349 domain-containing protein [Bacteroidetes bacterium]|nr:DUF349 domain-containing protein [Bacteroidota bacterium]